MFLWLAFRNSILTNGSRRKRGMCLEDTCLLCNTTKEDMLHILRDYELTKKMWQKIIPPVEWDRFMNLNLKQWIWWNISRKDSTCETEWNAIFTVICWWLWRHRNVFLFEGKWTQHEVLLAWSVAMVESMKEAHSKLIQSSHILISKVVIVVGWEPPAEGWCKLNVDGACSLTRKATACGGLMRDSRGQFVHGFMQCMDHGDTLLVEMWACIHGLRLTWDSGVRKVVLESDSTEALDLVTGDINNDHHDYHLIVEAKQMLSREWNVQLQYTSRNFNQAADFLAKYGLSSFPGYHVVLQVLAELEHLQDDWPRHLTSMGVT